MLGVFENCKICMHESTGNTVEKFPCHAKLTFKGRNCSTSLIQVHLGVCLDLFPDSGESIPSVGREVLGDPHIGEKIGFEAKYILRSLSAIQVAEDLRFLW